MGVEVLEQAKAAVLDLVSTEALLAELGKREALPLAVAEVTAEQLADDLARRAGIAAGSAAVAWREAQEHDDDLAVLEHAERVTRIGYHHADHLAGAAHMLLPSPDHPIARSARESAIAAQAAYRRTRELLQRAHMMVAHRRAREVARA